MTGSPDTSLTIDTHHHILPDFFWQATENAHAPVGGLAPLRWSKEADISFMDDAGIDFAVVSVSTPGVHTGDSAKARALARRCNEFSAELVHARPDRFGGFARLPLPEIDASLEELSYALDVLGLHGFVLFTNSNGVTSETLPLSRSSKNLRAARLYVHPNPSPSAVAHFEIGRHLTRVITIILVPRIRIGNTFSETTAPFPASIEGDLDWSLPGAEAEYKLARSLTQSDGSSDRNGSEKVKVAFCFNCEMPGPLADHRGFGCGTDKSAVS
jgi:hypothetical protein